MLKYFKKKPENADERPLGYINLVGAELSTTGTTTVDAKTLYTVTITEQGIEKPFVLGFTKDHIAQNWRGTAVQAIRGKVHPPVYLGHGKKKGVDSSSVANNLKQVCVRECDSPRIILCFSLTSSPNTSSLCSPRLRRLRTTPPRPAP